ncbi:MAG: 4Fe-4S binding protein [Methanospirillaceae archaeon]|nr:4Fe-4S binding protein [Methanospirillaceae archaeon]
MKLFIDETRCKGCNICTMVCPYSIFTPGDTPNRRGIYVPVLDRPERCTNCRLTYLYGRQLCGVCSMICPDQAISWIADEPYSARCVVIEY